MAAAPEQQETGVPVNQPDPSFLGSVQDQFGAKAAVNLGIEATHIIKIAVGHADINTGKVRVHGELFAQVALQGVDLVRLAAYDIGSQQAFGQGSGAMGMQQMALGLLQGQFGNIHHDIAGVPVQDLLGSQIRRSCRDQVGSPDQAQKSHNQGPANGSFQLHGYAVRFLWFVSTVRLNARRRI